MQNLAAADELASADFPLIAVRAVVTKADMPPKKPAWIKHFAVIWALVWHD
jgi:hypothetical protein